MSRLTLMALRSLRARMTRTLLTMFGVVLGVGVILAVSITNQSTMESITVVFTDASGKANLVVTSSSADEQGFAESAMPQAASVPGVQAVVPTVQGQVLLADEVTQEMGVSFFGAVGGGITLYGIDPALDVQARDYKIVEGRFLTNEPDARDIVLVKDYADDKSLQVGQNIEIMTSDGSTMLRIVGLMSKEGPGQLNNGAFGVVPPRSIT